MDPNIDDAGDEPGQEFDLRPPSIGFCTKRMEPVTETGCLICYTSLLRRHPRRMQCVEDSIVFPAKMAERDALVRRIAPMLAAMDAEDLRAVLGNIFETAAAHLGEATSKAFFQQIEVHVTKEE